MKLMLSCLFALCAVFPITANAQIASSCKSKKGDVYFERWKHGANPECDNGIKAPDGWELAYLTKDALAYIDYDSLVREGSTVKFWVEFMFAKPFMFDGKKPSDSSRNLYRFDCRKRQQTLLQASFRNKEKVIGEIVDGSFAEEIEPETISDALFAIVCQKPKRD
ncbi:MAG: surface-adhesin E family protein [Rickettsiales bacterium]